MKFSSGSAVRKKYILEANGTGVAMIDYDNDGRLDIFLVNGSSFDRKAAAVATNRLYRNLGNGRFTDVTSAAGLVRSGWGNGVCAADYDNDGNLDLYITYWGRNVLYRNLGNGRFDNVTSRANVGGIDGQWATGCTFLDYDRDGHIDLFFATYAGFDPVTTPLPGQFPYCTWKGAPVFCGPRGLPAGTATLYRNRGDGTFEDVSEKAGIRKVSGFYAFTAVTADLNSDGWPDIYVACDSTPSLLFRNNKDGTFGEVGTESGVAFNEHGSEQAGMGVGVGDFNRDGLIDLTKTNFSGDYPNIYRNIGRGIFNDVPIKSGLAVNPNYVQWGTAFADLDNDGWQDIFQVAGHVYADVQKIDPADSYKQPRVVYRALGDGRFEDVSTIAGPAIAEKHSSRGAAFGDFDNDGDIDVVVMNMHEPPSLIRNDLKSTNRWVQVKLQGTKSNRAAIGALVTIETGADRQVAPVLSQSSFLSQNDLRLHFGLGEKQRVDKFQVRWPSGEEEDFPAADAGGVILLVEGTGETRPIQLPR